VKCPRRTTRAFYDRLTEIPIFGRAGLTVPTPLTLSPAANGYRRSLYSGRAVSVYFDRHPINEWSEHTRDQNQISVFLDDASCFLKWKPPDAETRERQIQGPTVWLVPGGIPHSLVFPEEADMVTLFIERDFAAEIVDNGPARVTVMALAQLSARDGVIGQLTKAFKGLCRGRGTGSHLYIESIGTVLGTHLLQALLATENTSERGSGLPDEVLQRVTRYIDDHAGDHLNLTVLGRAAGYSPSHFGRLFKTSLGKTPHHYVMLRRVAKAEELLRATAMKEIEIALLCGFSDDTLMARWFRRVLDCVPSDIRNHRR
jgi:AraC family transcriptional regulator